MQGNRDSVSVAQGIFYVATGAWPLVHMRSFLRVTGPKTELWLVRTVGLLAIAIGVPLLRAGLRGRTRGEMAWLARTTAAAFVAADVPHVISGRISPVYLLDAAVEAGFLLAHRRREVRRRM